MNFFCAPKASKLHEHPLLSQMSKWKFEKRPQVTADELAVAAARVCSVVGDERTVCVEQSEKVEFPLIPENVVYLFSIVCQRDTKKIPNMCKIYFLMISFILSRRPHLLISVSSDSQFFTLPLYPILSDLFYYSMFPPILLTSLDDEVLAQKL